MTPRSQIQALEQHAARLSGSAMSGSPPNGSLNADRMSGALGTLQDYVSDSQRFEFNAQPSPNDVGGYLSALCFLRGALEALVEEVAVLRTREEGSRRTITEFHEQMRSAAAIQRDLLPNNLPNVAGLDVRALFRPAEALSGDLYDVFRIDDTQVGMALADATGHGLPGGVLATFVSRLLRGAPPGNGSIRSLQPDEVLRRINHHLIDAGFNECPFVTALHAVYDESSRTLTWARGGAPYPILIHRGDPPRQIKSRGPLIGVVADAEFEVVSLTLEPGDTVVFHTDGLEALVGDRRTQRGECDLANSEWFRRLGEQPLDQQLQNVEARLDSIDESAWRADDVTIVALHVREQ